MRVAVIGAGYAGLAAAVELAGSGIAPVVFEAARELGGRARRVLIEGQPLDNGQHILSGAYTELLRLMLRVGAPHAEHLQRMPFRLVILPEFRLERGPLPGRPGLAIGLLGARGLNWPERMRAAGMLHALARAGYRTAPEQTVDQLLEQHHQPHGLSERLWRPLCLAALNTHPAQASAQVYCNVLRDTLGGRAGSSDLLLPRSDLGRLFPDPARRFIEAQGGTIRTGCAVRTLQPLADGQWSVDSERFDRVILAAPPWASERLLAPVPAAAPLVRMLGSLDYEPIYTTYLELRRAVRLPEPMLGLSQGLTQWVFDRSALGGPPRVLAAVVSASGAHEGMALEAFGQTVARELSRALPQLPELRPIRTIAERRATLRCAPRPPGPPPPLDLPGLALAGDYTYADYPSTLEGAVRSGLRAAARVQERGVAAWPA